MKPNEELTGYERVRRAIEFDEPDRLPVMYERFGRTDAAFIDWGQIGTGDLTQRQSVDEWGCVWQRSQQENMG